MAETGAIFGGEHSGHFYYRGVWKADSGMLAAMHALAALGETAESTTLSDLLKPYLRYVMSGEINTKVSDAKAVIARIKETAIKQGSEIDELDGLTVSGDGWWFNVRSSNTEPLLRLNVEAKDIQTMEIVRDSVLSMMVDDQRLNQCARLNHMNSNEKENVEIQYQSTTGNWTPSNHCRTDDQRLAWEIWLESVGTN
jgi:phosphomannomutase